MEALLAKLVKRSESQENLLIDIKADIPGMSQKFKYYTTVLGSLSNNLGRCPPH